MLLFREDWKFVRSVPGDRVEYEAVDYPHWRGTPHFKKLVILLVPEESTRVAMTRTGEAHIASISPGSIREVEKARLRVVSVPGTMQAIFQFYGLYRPELQQSPLTDVRVREALFLAINRQQIIDHVMYGQASLLPWWCWRSTCSGIGSGTASTQNSGSCKRGTRRVPSLDSA